MSPTTVESLPFQSKRLSITVQTLKSISNLNITCKLIRREWLTLRDNSWCLRPPRIIDFHPLLEPSPLIFSQTFVLWRRGLIDWRYCCCSYYNVRLWRHSLRKWSARNKILRTTPLVSLRSYSPFKKPNLFYSKWTQIIHFDKQKTPTGRILRINERSAADFAAGVWQDPGIEGRILDFAAVAIVARWPLVGGVVFPSTAGTRPHLRPLGLRRFTRRIGVRLLVELQRLQATHPFLNARQMVVGEAATARPDLWKITTRLHK